jgi:SAM-dependent methyltransferase
MSEAFDEVSEAYEAMIDWPRRLAHETPLLEWCVGQCGARRVLDAACGTGHHVELLQNWGLEVEGADVSASMLARAHDRLGGRPSITLLRRSFSEPPGRSFDLVVCIGNSLALAGSADEAKRAISALASAVSAGGGLLLHLLNLWRLPDGPVHWQKSKLAPLSAGRRLIVKGVHRCGHAGYVDLVVTDPASALSRYDCIPFAGLRASELGLWLQSCGFAHIETFGDYSRKPYIDSTSQDLLIWARK